MPTRRPSKKVLTVLAASLTLLGVILYAVSSYAVWKGYESRLRSEQARLINLRQTALTGQDVTGRVSAIRKLDDAVSSRSELCKISPHYSWQASVVPLLGEGVSTCESAVSRLDPIAAPLGELRDYLDVAVKIQASAEKLKPSTDLPQSDWSELGLGRARTVQNELQAITTKGNKASDLKKQAVNDADELVAAWQSLTSIDTNQNFTGLLSSSVRVANAYGAFSDLADNTKQTIEELATKVSTASQGAV